MNGLTSIEVDLEVYKAIEGARLSFNESQNAILRRILLETPSELYEGDSALSLAQGERTTGSHSFLFKGKSYKANTQKAAYRKILLLLYETDKDFIKNNSSYRTSHGRRMIARDRPDLGSAAARQKAEILVDGYWFDTNLNLDQKQKRIKFACKKAGLEFGKDIIFPLLDK